MTDDGATDAEQRQIRDLLAAQPRPSMPAEVRERILTALADEPPLAPAAERRRARWWPAAVAAAVVLLAGVIVVPQMRQGFDSAPTAATAPVPDAELAVASPACAGGTAAYSTGTRYQQASLGQQARSLMPGAAQCRTDSAAAPPVAPRSPSSQSKALDCIVRIARQSQILLMDEGFYQEQPAVLAVVAPPRRALIVDCDRRPVQVLESVVLE